MENVSDVLNISLELLISEKTRSFHGLQQYHSFCGVLRTRQSSLVRARLKGALAFSLLELLDLGHGVYGSRESRLRNNIIDFAIIVKFY